MKKFSDLSKEVDEDLERKIQELYDTYGEIDEALIKKLNLQALIRRAKKTGIRMKRMMKNPAFKQKIARSKKRMKSTAQLLVKATKQARGVEQGNVLNDKKRSKLYPGTCPQEGVWRIARNLPEAAAGQQPRPRESPPVRQP